MFRPFLIRPSSGRKFLLRKLYNLLYKLYSFLNKN